MENQINAIHGANMGYRVGISAQRYNIIGVADFLTDKRSERISNIVEFFPQSVKIIRVSSDDTSTLAA